MTVLASLVLAGALAFTPNDAAVAHRTAAVLVEKYTPRDSGTERGRAAADYLRGAVVTNCPSARIDRFFAMTPDGLRRFVNVECEFVADTNAEWVVLVSHFDTKRGVKCPGANDGASTSGLLVAFAGVLARNPPRKVNVMLLWTDGEECLHAYDKNDGLWGSKRAAEKLVKAGRKVKAVICIDMLGDKSLTISIPRNVTSSLRRLALESAKRVGMAKRVKRIEGNLYDDHLPFLAAGFPAVNLIDFEYGSRPGQNDYWHTSSDTIDKVSEHSLLLSGRLITDILNRLQ